MNDQSPKKIQFFLTEASSCPYLPDREERKLFTSLEGRRAKDHIEALSEHGFRRSQNIFYRPACEECSSCKSVRVNAHEFRPSKSQRRITNRNGDVTGTELPPTASSEQYELFMKYLDARHSEGGMSDMGYDDYIYMVEDSPVRSMIVEYRLIDRNCVQAALVGVALCDIMDSGLSMVYSFFDPDYPARSLGKLMILDQIAQTRSLGFKYLHLGYWVSGSPKMSYKADFGPLEVVRSPDGWQPLTADDLTT